MPLTYSAIGNPSLDLVDGEYCVGGPSMYATVQASRLGFGARVHGVVGARDLPQFREFLERNDVDARELLAGGTTTVFENRYDSGGHRVQRLLSSVPAIPAASLNWNSADVIHFAPIANEYEITRTILSQKIQASLVGLTAQGLMRQRGTDGVVTLKELRLERDLARQLDVVVVSEEEAHYCAALLDDVVDTGGVTAITRGLAGAILQSRGHSVQVPAMTGEIVDPTGAGDVFATALFAGLHSGRALKVAGRYAAAAAGLCVASRGVDGVPTLAQVLAAEGT